MNQSRSDFTHQPVLVDEIASLLVTDKNGAYIDLTAGLGGHLNALSKKLGKKARLYGIDKDRIALRQAEEKLKKVTQKTRLVHASYVEIGSITERLVDTKFDGALLDLGLSSLQLDDSRRGFSFSSEGPLDMRFDQEASTATAADLVNELEQRQLSEIIFKFGEEKRAKVVAAAIVRERQKEMILTTSQLTQIIRSVIKSPHQTKSLARVFQALRIAVNNELQTLQDAIPGIIKVLKKFGRLAIISYHSLEDRIVKNTFREFSRKCNCPSVWPECKCGAKQLTRIITKRPVYPSDNEIQNNPRARSARLRVAERIV